MSVFRRWLAQGRSRICALRERLGELLAENDCEARGLKLLREWLSPEQLAQFNANSYFDVIGCDSGKKYRIRYGSSMNIEELDDRGRPRACYCFLPDLHLVPGDIWRRRSRLRPTNVRRWRSPTSSRPEPIFRCRTEIRAWRIP
jgi:hypothetical protein